MLKRLQTVRGQNNSQPYGRWRDSPAFRSHAQEIAQLKFIGAGFVATFMGADYVYSAGARCQFNSLALQNTPNRFTFYCQLVTAHE